MSSYTLLERDEAHVLTLWLNRPEKLNAFNAEFIAELTEQIRTVANDSSARLLVLRAKGKHFCAGADLEWMRAAIDLNEAENLADAKLLGDMLWAFWHLEVPTLAVVHGAAYGGAVGLVACCDMVLALENTTFCLSEVNMGLIPATIGPYVAKSIGYKQALYYAMTAERISALSALQIGLVHKVIQIDQAEEDISGFVQSFVQKGAYAQRACKVLFRQIDQSEINLSLKQQTEQFIAHCRTTKEAQQRLSEFLKQASS